MRKALKLLTRRRLEKHIDSTRLIKSITAAEQKTSGEIRICLSRFFWGSIYRAAEQSFVKMGMAQTRQRNGVLFFVVPSRRKFVILGDHGIHKKVGENFWNQTSKIVSGFFKEGKFTEGLEAGVQTVGEILAEHFAYDPETDINELEDGIRFQ